MESGIWEDPVKLDYLRSFIAVAESKSFTRASELLYIGQPALSRQIASLEDYLGITLLARSTRSVELTEAGFIFLDTAREMVRLFDDSLRSMRLSATTSENALSVGFVYHYLSAPLANVLDRFCEAHADYKVDVVEDSIEKLFDQLVDGSLDAALLGVTDYSLIPGKIAHQLIDVHEEEILVGRNHPLASKDAVTVDDLKDQPFVYPYFRPSVYISPLKREMLDSGYDFNILNVGFDANVFEIVEKGEAIVGLPTSRQKANHDLVAVRLQTEYRIYACLLWNPDNKKKTLRDLVDFAAINIP